MLFIAIILILSKSDSVAQNGISDIERLLNEAEGQLVQIDASMGKLKQQSDSLAVLINALKQKDDLSFFERRRLDGLLKTSEKLSGAQEQVQAMKGNWQQQRGQLIAKLESLYAASIDSLLNYTGGHAELTSQEKTEIAGQVRSLSMKRRVLRESVPLFSEMPDAPNPQIETDDTPDEIEAKADFYRDWEDKYREKATLLQGRIKKVREETTLRKRMAELVDDTRLFDHRDEAYAPKASSTVSETDQGSAIVGRGKGNEVAVDFSNAHPLNAAEQLLNLEFQSLPIYDVDSYLKVLHEEKQKLMTAADSLAGVARLYDTQAKKLRNSIEHFER